MEIFFISSLLFLKIGSLVPIILLSNFLFVNRIRNYNSCRRFLPSLLSHIGGTPMLISDPRQIGNRLLAIRKHIGLTQAEVAEAAGLSDRAYADIERGSVNMRIDTALRICQSLHITPDEILTAGWMPAAPTNRKRRLHCWRSICVHCHKCEKKQETESTVSCFFYEGSFLQYASFIQQRQRRREASGGAGVCLYSLTFPRRGRGR